MKTAMQQLIEWAKLNLPDKYLHMVVEKANELLPIERQQLEDAWEDGKNQGIGGYPKPTTFNYYFKTTYNE